MAKTLEFILKDPIKYASKGEEVLGYKIVATAPTGRVRNQLIQIKQAFFQAMSLIRANPGQQQPAAQEEIQDQDKNPMTGDQAMMLLYMSGIDMVKFEETVRDMLITGQLLKIENEVNMGPNLIDKIELEEFERLIGEYLASFLLPSLLRQ